MRSAGLWLRGRELAWGSRTFVMGIVNVTPDSFSGDGLPPGPIPSRAAVAQAVRMAAEGADILDIGGESSRPGHVGGGCRRGAARASCPVVRAVRAALPDMPLEHRHHQAGGGRGGARRRARTCSTTSGASAATGAMARLAAERGVPIVLMHDRPLAASDA